MDAREKVELVLNDLEIDMKSQLHLECDKINIVLEKVNLLEKVWSQLNQNDREFLGAVKFAIKTQYRWD